MKPEEFLKTLDAYDPIFDDAIEYEYTEQQMLLFAEKYYIKKSSIINEGGNMFTEEQMEKAWNDGGDCMEQRGGFFDINNYQPIKI